MKRFFFPYKKEPSRVFGYIYRPVVEMRRRNAVYMSERLSDISKAEPPNPPRGFFHVYQMYTVRVKGGGKARGGLKDYLAEKGVMTKVYFSPVHLTSFYKGKFGFKGGELPITERLSNQILTLPVYASLTKDEMNYIASGVSDFMENMS